MDKLAQTNRAISPTPSPSHQRKSSGSSSLFKFPFIKPSDDSRQSRLEMNDNGMDGPTRTRSVPTARPSTSILQQSKTRRRRGSLRKVALLSRGAQRERRDSRSLAIDTSHIVAYGIDQTTGYIESPTRIDADDALGFEDSSDLTPRASIHEYLRPADTLPTSSTLIPTSAAQSLPTTDQSSHGSYTSTDEEEVLQLPRSSTALRQGLITPGPDSYFGGLGASALQQQRRQSIHRAKSPLSFSGLSTSTLPADDWDYSATEWWGWVVLCVTWFVFVIGMGSCFDVWSWAWDVGKTPYAPPELEDDPTLPIVGYYPALMILTGVMAWVWVINAWVGMKYFRHAKISGD